MLRIVGIVDNSYPFHEVDIAKIRRSIDVNLWANICKSKTFIMHLTGVTNEH